MAAAKDAEILKVAQGLSACVVTLDADYHDGNQRHASVIARAIDAA